MLSELTERKLGAAAFTNLLFLHPWKQEINHVYVMTRERMTRRTVYSLCLTLMNFLLGNNTREETHVCLSRGFFLMQHSEKATETSLNCHIANETFVLHNSRIS